MCQLDPLSHTLFGAERGAKSFLPDIWGQTETDTQGDRQKYKGHNDTEKKVTHSNQCKHANMDSFGRLWLNALMKNNFK